MKTVPMNQHDFRKTNLVTLKGGGDNYKCTICGAEGLRRCLSDIITLTDSQHKKSLKCTFTPDRSTTRKPRKVLLDDMPYVLVECGIHEVVDSPAEYKDKFIDDVWVFSELLGEKVRILPHEIIDLEY